MNTKPKEYREYPNRKRLREMYNARYNRHLTYDQFRNAVKRDIDMHNEQVRVETIMNEQMSKKDSTEGGGQK